MPTITPPPNFNPLPEPEPEISKSVQERIWAKRKVDIFLNVPSWKCPECETVNFGRNKQCVYCKHVLHKDTPRPPGEGVEKLRRKDDG